MAALTADSTNNLALAGDTVDIPVAATTKLYRGSMIDFSGGYAKALTSGGRFAGHTQAQADNSTGAAGDINAAVLQGEQGNGYTMESTLTGANEYMKNAPVYALDDNLLSLGPMLTPVGVVRQYISSGIARVRFVPNLSRRALRNLVGEGSLFEDFFGWNAENWTVTTLAHASTITRTAAVQGGLSVVTAGAENDGSNIQLNGTMFKLDVGKPVAWGTRFSIDDVTQSDFILGLCVVDVDLFGGMTDGIYFEKSDGAATVTFVTEAASTETTSGTLATMVDATKIALGFVWDGVSAVYPYINGVRGTAVTTNIPTGVWLTPSMELLTGAAAARTFLFDFVDAYNLR